MATIIGAFEASLFVPSASLPAVQVALDAAPAIFYDTGPFPFPYTGNKQVWKLTLWVGAASVTAAQTAISTALAGVSVTLALGTVTAL